jgi:hypothetical protein
MSPGLRLSGGSSVADRRRPHSRKPSLEAVSQSAYNQIKLSPLITATNVTPAILGQNELTKHFVLHLYNRRNGERILILIPVSAGFHVEYSNRMVLNFATANI